MIIGGVYFCFEGVEKLLYKFLYVESVEDENSVLKEDKIKGVICIDFIFLVEIIIIVFGVL